MHAPAPQRFAVVGGGWAGCAAACELAQCGHHVTLLESSRVLGGRARRVEVGPHLLDNGQHILLGAYKESLRLMRLVGIDLDAALLRLPLQMPYAPKLDGMQFIAPRLPAPLHLLAALFRAKGLKREDKLAIARFQSTARWMDWVLYEDCSVTELLARYDQTPAAIRLLWQPLCVAALNTPPAQASAQVFLNVLKDSLGGRRTASDMLLPRTDLSRLFPEMAGDYLQRRGGSVRLGARVEGLTPLEQGWALDIAGQARASFDGVVLAVPPWQAKVLLAPIAPGRVPAFTYEPITTCYLQYPTDTALTRPFFALLDQFDQGDWGQFVFDRGHVDRAHAGMLAVVTSAAHEPAQLEHGRLAADMAAQLARAFGRPALASPQWSQVITEKRATFSCTPGLQRPAVDTGQEGLWLAGDYTAGPYPATIESAVISGVAAAAGLHQSSSRTRLKA
ncbi:MAG: hypothetical protein JWP36_1509 [Paucimonas sp.]|nr:hypothetical protein [Paucimonas sp.]